MIRSPSNPAITDEALNAYVDGALTSDDAARIARSAAAVPEIANRIAVLHHLKAGVAGFADDMVIFDTPMLVPAAPHRRTARLRLAALAAAAAVMLSVLWLVDLTNEPDFATADEPVMAVIDDPLAGFIARHDAWTEGKSTAAAPRTTDWLDGLMEATGLSLVHEALLPIGAGAPVQHFAFVGPRGCRLSLFEASLQAEAPSRLDLSISDGLLTAKWAAGGRGYALIARSMDRTRFATIAAAIHDASRSRGSVDAQLLAGLRQARQPCLG